MVALDKSLLLLPTIQDLVFQEIDSKKYTFMSLSFSNFKMVFTLLIETVIFYIQVTIVKIGILRLEQLIEIVFWPYCYWYLAPNLFDAGFHKLFE